MGNPLKRIVSVICVMYLTAGVYGGSVESYSPEEPAKPRVKQVVREVDTEEYRTLHPVLIDEDEIRNEVMYGEIELLAQLVEAEAGNQDELGKRYVADVVLNRIDSPIFPDNMYDVIFQDKPTQFTCVADGGFDKAAWYISEESFKVALEEYTETRVNTEIMYYRTERYSDSGHPAFKHGDHYFSTL